MRVARSGRNVRKMFDKKCAEAGIADAINESGWGGGVVPLTLRIAATVAEPRAAVGVLLFIGGGIVVYGFTPPTTTSPTLIRTTAEKGLAKGTSSVCGAATERAHHLVLPQKE